MDLSHQEDATVVGGGVDESRKSCAMCGTEKTPLWRSGPAGPKSLCNACGIKHRKRKALMCKNPDKRKLSQSSVIQLLPTSKETSSKAKARLEKSASSNLQQSVKVGLAAFGKDMALLQKKRSFIRRQRSEEEEAAALLLSLSCGYVFA